MMDDNTAIEAQTKESQSKITSLQAHQLIREGNQRFLNNKPAPRDLISQMKSTSSGQYPYAVVLSCIDSRVPAELVLDQGIGDIFSIRIAGNIVNQDILGSMEFACKIAGSKLILVLGHTSCGAVKGACDRIEMGNLTATMNKLKPVVDSVFVEGVDGQDSSNEAFVNKVTRQNVLHVMQEIKNQSPILREMIDEGSIDLQGAIYDVKTGKVEFGVG